MKEIFEGQARHLGALLILLCAVILIFRSGQFLTGELYGVSTANWFLFAIAIAIVHQVYAWFCWRTQLHRKLLTRALGKYGFEYFAVGFVVLMLSRLALLILVSIANKGSLAEFQTLLNVVAAVFVIPAVWLLFSIQFYFGARRAFGLDHFDEKIRTMPLVREGIFKYNRNSMYTFGLLIFWLPGLLCASKAGLLAAAFHHAYIWVHYFTVEKPDMKRIYGS